MQGIWASEDVIANMLPEEIKMFMKSKASIGHMRNRSGQSRDLRSLVADDLPSSNVTNPIDPNVAQNVRSTVRTFSAPAIMLPMFVDQQKSKRHSRCVLCAPFLYCLLSVTHLQTVCITVKTAISSWTFTTPRTRRDGGKRGPMGVIDESHSLISVYIQQHRWYCLPW